VKVNTKRVVRGRVPGERPPILTGTIPTDPNRYVLEERHLLPAVRVGALHWPLVTAACRAAPDGRRLRAIVLERCLAHEEELVLWTSNARPCVATVEQRVVELRVEPRVGRPIGVAHPNDLALPIHRKLGVTVVHVVAHLFMESSTFAVHEERVVVPVYEGARVTAAERHGSVCHTGALGSLFVDGPHRTEEA